MTQTVCKQCRCRYTADKAAYVFPQTGGLCWACHDRMADARFLAKQTTAKRRAIKARWDAVEAVTDAESNLHCQFGGLPQIGRRTK